MVIAQQEIHTDISFIKILEKLIVLIGLTFGKSFGKYEKYSIFDNTPPDAINVGDNQMMYMDITFHFRFCQ